MSWFIHRTIAAKILVCFGCVIAVGLIAGVFTYRSLTRVEVTEVWTSHTFEVLDISKEIRIAILKQESDVRGYLLTRDTDFLDRANLEYRSLVATIGHLRLLTGDDASQTQRIDSLSKIVETWRAQTTPSAEVSGFGPLPHENHPRRSQPRAALPPHVQPRRAAADRLDHHAERGRRRECGAVLVQRGDPGDRPRHDEAGREVVTLRGAEIGEGDFHGGGGRSRARLKGRAGGDRLTQVAR